MKIRVLLILAIISLAAFVIYFVLPGFANGRCLPSNQLDDFLLILSKGKFFNVQCPSKDENIQNIGKEDFTNTSRLDYWYIDMTFSCANNSIYVLKRDRTSIAHYHTLDVMNFDENNKLKTVTHVNGIFDGAKSITSDWTTGKIYWTVSSNKQFSIKVIDKSFEKLEYIIQPNKKTYMKKLLVYPKRKELFFLSNGKLWYTSNSRNSNASLLFESGKEFQKIDDFTIDYATDKLYLIESFEGHSILKRIDIGTFGRPFNVSNVDEIGRIPFGVYNLVAFNNKIYWTLSKDGVSILYFKNNYEQAVEIINLSGNISGNLSGRLSFVSSSCPSSTAEKKEQSIITTPKKIMNS